MCLIKSAFVGKKEFYDKKPFYKCLCVIITYIGNLLYFMYYIAFFVRIIN